MLHIGIVSRVDETHIPGSRNGRSWFEPASRAGSSAPGRPIRRPVGDRSGGSRVDRFHPGGRVRTVCRTPRAGRDRSGAGLPNSSDSTIESHTEEDGARLATRCCRMGGGRPRGACLLPASSPGPRSVRPQTPSGTATRGPCPSCESPRCATHLLDALADKSVRPGHTF